jgi:3-oxoacyl-[acyl-carrier-protein] synthase-3
MEPEMRRIYIKGTGSYLPEGVITNQDVARMIQTDSEWIKTRTGIEERRKALPDQAASDLALEASKKAMEVAGVTSEDLDLIIMATITPDTHCPSGANWLEAKLRADRSVSFDVTAACSGFIFALSVAEKFMKADNVSTTLVAASEVMTRVQDWTDRTNCILWGDGAGAAVLSTEPGGHEILSIHLHTDGEGGKTLLMPGGGSATTPITHESVDAKKHTLKMIKANESFRVAVTRFSESCREAVENQGISLDDVKMIIPHQANLRIIQAFAKKLSFPMEKVFVNIDKYGNISSATVPIALDEAACSGGLEPGDWVILVAFGGGLTWGSALVRW